MKNDGPTFVYDEIHAAPGMHKLIVKIKDSKEVNPLIINLRRRWRLNQER